MANESSSNNELKSLEEVFDDGSRIFRIPDYQRGYSWEEKQRHDLLTDIEYLINAKFDYRHYTGTIVASLNHKETKEEEHEGYEVFDIVDGQQRITSLILLISVICNRFWDGNKVEGKLDYPEIYNRFVMDGQLGDSIPKLRFASEATNALFDKLVTDKVEGFKHESTSKSDDNLKVAVRQYLSWLKSKNISNVSTKTDVILKCVCDHLGFLMYAPENHKELGIMFEVINNRGKTLTELEKIKNYLIYYSDKNNMGDIKKNVNRSWPIILNNLNQVDFVSNEREDQFLRNCLITSIVVDKSKSYQIYESLKEKWPPSSSYHTREILSFIGFLERASSYYKRYLKLYGVANESERKVLERISCQPVDASIMPLVLSICERASSDEKRVSLLELVEKLNFRYYVTGIAGRSDSGQGELFRYANQFYNYYGVNDGNQYIDDEWLSTALVGFIASHANDKELVEYLTLDKDESGDYYHWIGLKYFLASYEEHLAEGQKKSVNLKKIIAPRDPNNPNDFFNREHIWARNHLDEFDKPQNLNVNKRRLGNFILLNEGLNIKVSDHAPQIKMGEYFSYLENTPDTKMIWELKEFFDQAEEDTKLSGRINRTNMYWYDVYQRFLDAREEKLINFALDRWRVPELEDNIDDVEINSRFEGNEVYHYEVRLDSI